MHLTIRTNPEQKVSSLVESREKQEMLERTRFKLANFISIQ